MVKRRFTSFPAVFFIWMWSACGLPSIGFLAPPTLVENAPSQLQSSAPRMTGFSYDENDIVEDPARFFLGFDLVYRIYPLTENNQRPWTALLESPSLDQPTGIQFLQQQGFRRFRITTADNLELDGPDNTPTISFGEDELGTFILVVDPATNALYDAAFADQAMLFRDFHIPDDLLPPIITIFQRQPGGDQRTFWQDSDPNINLDAGDVNSTDAGGNQIEEADITEYGVVVFVAAVGFDDNDGSPYHSEPLHLKALDGQDALIIEL